MAVTAEKNSAENIPAAVVSSTLAFMGYGTSAVMIHLYAVDKAHPLFFAILRLSVSIPLLFLASAIAEGGVPRRPQCLHEVLFIFIIGVLALTQQIAVTLAMFLTNSLAVGIFELGFPVLVSVASVLTGTEKKPDFSTIYGWIRTLVIIPTIGGAAALVVISSENDQSAPKHCGFSEGAKSKQADWTVGTFFLVTFTVSLSAMVIMQKRLFNRYQEWKKRPVTVLAWAIPFSYPLLWVFYPAGAAIINAKTSCGETIGLWTLEGTAIYALEWHIFFNATNCILLLAFASACAPPSVVSFFAPMHPITAVILSQLFLDYSISVGEYISMLVIMASFFAFLWAKRQEERVQKDREGQRTSTAPVELEQKDTDVLY